MVVSRALQHRFSRFRRCQMRAGIISTAGERRKGRRRAEVGQGIDVFYTRIQSFSVKSRNLNSSNPESV